QVGAHGHLRHAGEAQALHGGGEALGGGLRAELAQEGGGHDGHHLVPPLDGVDELEDLALVHDGAEGAVHQAHAAGDALVVVDLGPAVVVGADGVHAAGLLTGALQLDDGVVLAGLGAAAALDALVLLDVALAVDVADGVLVADLLAGPGQAALAVLGDAV